MQFGLQLLYFHSHLYTTIELKERKSATEQAQLGHTQGINKSIIFHCSTIESKKEKKCVKQAQLRPHREKRETTRGPHGRQMTDETFWQMNENMYQNR
jgi:hypothetical protein